MSDDFDVPVTVFLPVAMYRRLARAAVKHQTTVPLLVLEVVRRQLASNDARRPKVKKLRSSWTAEHDQLLRVLHAEGKSDNFIAHQMGKSQGNVSLHRNRLGLPRLFRSPNPGKAEK